MVSPVTSPCAPLSVMTLLPVLTPPAPKLVSLTPMVWPWRATTSTLPPAVIWAPPSTSDRTCGLTLTRAVESRTEPRPEKARPSALPSPSALPLARSATLPPTLTTAPPATSAVMVGLTVTMGSLPLTATSRPPVAASARALPRPPPAASTVRLAPVTVALPTLALLVELASATALDAPTATPKVSAVPSAWASALSDTADNTSVPPSAFTDAPSRMAALTVAADPARTSAPLIDAKPLPVPASPSAVAPCVPSCAACTVMRPPASSTPPALAVTVGVTCALASALPMAATRPITSASDVDLAPPLESAPMVMLPSAEMPLPSVWVTRLRVSTALPSLADTPIRPPAGAVLADVALWSVTLSTVTSPPADRPVPATTVVSWLSLV